MAYLTNNSTNNPTNNSTNNSTDNPTDNSTDNSTDNPTDNLIYQLIKLNDKLVDLIDKLIDRNAQIENVLCDRLNICELCMKNDKYVKTMYHCEVCDADSDDNINSCGKIKFSKCIECMDHNEKVYLLELTKDPPKNRVESYKTTCVLL